MMNKILCRTQTLIFAVCFDFTRIGESTKPMTRAKISTHKGVAEQTFTPAHVTIFASDMSDLSESNIMNKVSFQIRTNGQFDLASGGNTQYNYNTIILY